MCCRNTYRVPLEAEVACPDLSPEVDLTTNDTTRSKVKTQKKKKKIPGPLCKDIHYSQAKSVLITDKHSGNLAMTEKKKKATKKSTRWMKKYAGVQRLPERIEDSPAGGTATKDRLVLDGRQV